MTAKTGRGQNKVAVIPREEILGIPKKVYEYAVSKLKYNDNFIESCGANFKLSELSLIRYRTTVGSIGWKRDETSSTLFLWVHPSYDSNYKIEISCGFFHEFISSVPAIYEKVRISFPSFGLTLFSPDEISIILLVFEGLKNVTPPELFRRVK